MGQSPLALQISLQSQDDCPETRLKNGLFSPRNCPPRVTTALHMPCSLPICIPWMAQSVWKNGGPHSKHLRGKPTIVMSLKAAPKRPFLDTKSAIKWARRLKTARSLFVVIRLCFLVVWSYLDATFEPRIRRKDFVIAYLLVLAPSACCVLKCVTQPWTPRQGVKPQQGKPNSVNNFFPLSRLATRTELGPSLG